MAMTKAQRSEAAKKAARTRKRNASRTTPAKRRPAAKAKTRRRVTTKKKGMLSEMFNPKMAQAGAKTMLGGVVGGFSATTIIKMTPNQTPNMQAGIIAATSFVAATMLKMPNVAAGMTAIATYKMMENAGMLAEGDDMQLANYAEPIEQLPMVLNENGEVNFELSQNAANGDLFLQDDGYNVGYYESGFDGAGYV